MVITDTFSKYVELVAIPNKRADTVANAIFIKWICRHRLQMESYQMEENGQQNAQNDEC